MLHKTTPQEAKIAKDNPHPFKMSESNIYF